MAINIHSDDWLLNNNSQFIGDLKLGEKVKIANNLEKFWVQIIEINNNYIIGKIDNYLTYNSEYDYQDIVIFEKENILEIYNKFISFVLNKHFKTNCKIKDF